LQTLGTALFSIGGFFFGEYTSDKSDIELFTGLHESANSMSHLPPDHHAVTMILSQKYQKTAEMWGSILEKKRRKARRDLWLGILSIFLGSLSLILSAYL